MLIVSCLSSSVYAQNKPDDFTNVATLTSNIEVELRYLGSDNFVGKQIEGYQANKCYMQSNAAIALAKLADDIVQHGYKLKVYDCYRPQRAVSHFMRWAADLSDTRTKDQYYPDLEKHQLINEYIAEKSGHSRGSTLDVGLLSQDENGLWQELDMGSPFDFFGPISNVGSSLINQSQQQNRQILLDLMQQQNFNVYPMEWWHFTHQPPAYIDTYFDFVIE
ncbi:peptidase M15 [Paraglaciecola hydrolytica]|uniref:D-alanyl-D-alanine dipeptidase n=1 Tax=Paraglaciecola hydrolytica TaxID=1799789 RepID=A0A148KNV4_9ALTE|nr:peptidase M15 [Paraglaciecola hydrolytica]